ncbi:uncharacterized protein LOC118974560 [Sturnira hondurensis]|uniref:uncharacterized protein LOC118974560 n=1 Tax=Sturnira hondurensis TaxID=192404 RepID=UPI00187AB9ED|nr:uncharacterized protein LOC118974560 [Sturnira hondurensis]
MGARPTVAHTEQGCFHPTDALESGEPSVENVPGPLSILPSEETFAPGVKVSYEALWISKKDHTLEGSEGRKPLSTLCPLGARTQGASAGPRTGSVGDGREATTHRQTSGKQPPSWKRHGESSYARSSHLLSLSQAAAGTEWSSHWRETGHSDGANWRPPWPPIHCSPPGTASSFAPRACYGRKEAELQMSSAEVRQDSAGSTRGKGPAGHVGKKVHHGQRTPAGTHT